VRDIHGTDPVEATGRNLRPAVSMHPVLGMLRGYVRVSAIDEKAIRVDGDDYWPYGVTRT